MHLLIKRFLEAPLIAKIVWSKIGRWAKWLKGNNFRWHEKLYRLFPEFS